VLRPVPASTASLTVSTVGVGLTVPANKKIVVAKLTVFAQPIRYTRDTTTPTATLGHYATDKGRILLIGQEEIRGFRAIREGGADATVVYSFYEGTYGPDDIALLAAGL
jgi:hypothetical protein